MLALCLGLGSVQPASAQIQTIDPNDAYSAGGYQSGGQPGGQSGGAIDGDLNGELPPVSSNGGMAGDPYAPAPAPAPAQAPAPAPAQDPYAPPTAPAQQPGDPYSAPVAAGAPTDVMPAEQAAKAAAASGDTYQEDDLMGAAEGVFGQGAEGLAGLIALQFGHTILNIAALGFLGVGIQPPAPEWGAMIAEARPYFSRAPWLAIVPGLFLFALTALALAIARSLSRRRDNALAGLLAS